MDFVKDADSFGVRIDLTYKGDKEYKTFVGGSMSLVAKFIILVYIGFQLYNIITKHTNMNFVTDYINLIYDETVYKVNLDNFDLATRLMYTGSNKDVFANRERYVDIYYTYSEYYIDEQGNYEMKFERINAVPCTTDRFVRSTD